MTGSLGRCRFPNGVGREAERLGGREVRAGLPRAQDAECSICMVCLGGRAGLVVHTWVRGHRGKAGTRNTSCQSHEVWRRDGFEGRWELAQSKGVVNGFRGAGPFAQDNCQHWDVRASSSRSDCGAWFVPAAHRRHGRGAQRTHEMRTRSMDAEEAEGLESPEEERGAQETEEEHGIARTHEMRTRSMNPFEAEERDPTKRTLSCAHVKLRASGLTPADKGSDSRQQPAGRPSVYVCVCVCRGAGVGVEMCMSSSVRLRGVRCRLPW